MNKTAGILGGLGLGAGVLYFLDPNKGRRRRRLVQDKAGKLARHSGRAIGKSSQDIANRVRGAIADGIERMSREPVDDDVLIARVRSRIGRVVGRPSAIHVAADQGRITLRGHVLKHEAKDLLSAVWAVAGVREVRDRLEQHKRAQGVPELDGSAAGKPHGWGTPGGNWNPALRAVAGAAGAGLIGYAARDRRAPATLAGVLGAGLLVRAISNKDVSRIAGIGARRRAIGLHKTLNIDAPVEEVYEFWRNYQNFPRFMTHLREVRDTGHRKSHWVAAAPGGISVSWDAEITEAVPNRVLAWKSLPGSAIENSGHVRFEKNNGGTRLEIRISYTPPGGAMGHAAASLFGADPNREMEEDLLRLKSLLERGKTRAHGQSGYRSEF